MIERSINFSVGVAPVAGQADEQPSVRKERAETTRQRILDAALACFSRRGFDRTSTAAIAKAAGVSQGIIFHHFGTKDGLISAVVRAGIEGFRACATQAEQSHLAPPEKIHLLLRLMGEMALAFPSRTDIIIRQVFQVQLDTEKVENFGIAEVLQTIGGAFEEGKRSGAFGDLDVQTATLSVLGIYVANYVGWSALGKTYDFVEALGRGCSMFLDGVARR